MWVVAAGPRDEHRTAPSRELREDAVGGEQQQDGEERKLHVHTTRGRLAIFHRIAAVKVGVVGLGTMGAGIAQISVAAGHETVGREVSDDLAERGRSTIERYLGRAVEKERMTAEERDAALGRLT